MFSCNQRYEGGRKFISASCKGNPSYNSQGKVSASAPQVCCWHLQWLPCSVPGEANPANGSTQLSPGPRISSRAGIPAQTTPGESGCCRTGTDLSAAESSALRPLCLFSSGLVRTQNLRGILTFLTSQPWCVSDSHCHRQLGSCGDRKKLLPWASGNLNLVVI